MSFLDVLDHPLVTITFRSNERCPDWDFRLAPDGTYCIDLRTVVRWVLAREMYDLAQREMATMIHERRRQEKEAKP